jgi:hypothetical protein
MLSHRGPSPVGWTIGSIKFQIDVLGILADDNTITGIIVTSEIQVIVGVGHRRRKKASIVISYRFTSS